MNRKPRTFAATFAAALAHTTIVASVIVGGILFALIESPTAVADRPAPPNSPAGLIAQHHCWTGEAPEGETAGHVVVTLDGDSAPTYGGRRLTAKAIGQTLGEGYVGTIHAFCQ